jgi:glycosyltransferase involved in cell wall biosynthesis
MRIAILCPSFGEYAGIGRIAHALGTEFAALGHELALVSRPPRVLDTFWGPIPRLELPLHQQPRTWRHVARQLRFARDLAVTRARLGPFLRETGADVLLTLGISTFAPIALVATRIVPVVVSLQGGEPDGRFVSHPHLFRRLLRRAGGIAACARSLARQARELEPSIEGRLRILPNGVDPRPFAAAVPYAHGRPYVLAAGRLTRQKGFDVLIDAMARAGSIRRGEADLVVAGDGPEQHALTERASERGIEERVRFLGAVDATRMASLHRGAAVVAVPSRWEGLPLVCLEAMASGRPVVASAVDGIPDAVLDGTTGLLVAPDDPGALAQALDALLRDAARADALGAAGRTRARTTFAWPLIARGYVDLLAGAAR